ncbi:MAG: HipA domain-containing protein [Luteolibacter sp.]
MTVSKCYVWRWLPGATEPVVAGELRFDAKGRQSFVYGRSFPNLVDQLRIHGLAFKKDATELFSRLVFNVLLGNTDDHARKVELRFVPA